MLCKIHNEQILTFCIDCRKEQCVDCIMEHNEVPSKQKHQIKKINQLVQEWKQYYQKEEKVDSQEQDYESEQYINELRQNVQQIVDDFFNQLMNQHQQINRNREIDDQEQDLVDRLFEEDKQKQIEAVIQLELSNRGGQQKRVELCETNDHLDQQLIDLLGQSFQFDYKNKHIQCDQKQGFHINQLVEHNNSYIKVTDQGINISEIDCELGMNYKYLEIQPRNQIVVCGGLDNNENLLKQTVLLDLNSNQIERLEDMKEPKIGHSLVHKDNKIYCIGGSTQNRHKLNKVYVMDLDENQWLELEPMKYSRSGCSSVIHDGFIYVVGGINIDGINENDVSIYDIEMGSWSQVRMSNSVNYMGYVDSGIQYIGNNQIIVLGGLQNNHENVKLVNTIGVYDIQYNTFINLTQHFKLPIDFVVDSKISINNNQIVFVAKVQQNKMLYGPFEYFLVAIEFSNYQWFIKSLDQLDKEIYNNSKWILNTEEWVQTGHDLY